MTESASNAVRSRPPIEPPPEVSARIRQRIALDLDPKRGPSVPARWVLGLGAVAATFVAVVVTAADHMLGGPRRSLAILLVGVFLIAAATFMGLARSGSAPVSVRTRIAIALLPPVAFLGVVWLAHGFLPLDGTSGQMSGGASTFGCLVRGAMLAALPMAVLVLLWRRTDPFTPRLTGALIGGWAGLTGAVGLTVACPSTDLFHVAIGHGGALVGGAMLGMLLGKRLLSP